MYEHTRSYIGLNLVKYAIYPELDISVLNLKVSDKAHT